VLFLVLYYIIGYRKKITATNLRNAFPEKSDAEIQTIIIKYYRHLCDIILETFKLLGMRRSELNKRCRIINYELYFDILSGQRSIIVALGHQGNWEWLGAATATRGDGPLQVIYKPLSNPYFDRLMKKIRSRFGATPIPDKDVLRQMIATKGSLSTTAFISDQTPPPDHAFWINFLNQDTPVFIGTEKLARRLNYPVLFAAMRKVKRGYYEVEVLRVCDEPAESDPGSITTAHTRLLEEQIIKQPETWLWSHRRWKHQRHNSKQ
jgi:KDO2-lipid IV(A) lauroyltransferase